MINTYEEWNGFRGGNWQRETDVRSFILKNFTPYDGDESFLAQPTAKTKAVWGKCEKLLQEELDRGVLDIETHIISGIDNFAPGYIDTDLNAALIADATRNRQILERIPAGRWGKPEDIASAVVFLASRGADYINGIVLPVDGGWLGA